MSDMELVGLTAEVVSAYVSSNAVAAADVPGLLREVHASFAALGAPAAPAAPALEPAVPVRSSVKPDHIVCLEDGAKLKMLKRYLRTRFGLSPEEYRRKWGLPRDYPMVAPAYAEVRRDLAVRTGLGRKPARAAAQAASSPAEAAAPRRRGRPRKAA